MIQVIKRDGEVMEFNLIKITEAIKKAFKATGKEYNDDILQLISLRVTSDFQSKMTESTVTVEQIQDSVEQVLEQTGYTDVAKSYILYRKQREKVRNMSATSLDYKDVINTYVHCEDWRMKENSTVTYSVGGLILNNSGAVTANYWLSEIYDQEVSDAHKNADIHIHDLSMLTGYSCGWSLKQLIMEGLGGITGKITAAPAKHLSTLCNQMVNFLGIMQNEWAAAQSFSSFDTYLAPFVRTESLSYDKVKKAIEAFVFGVNTPSRWGTQAPFSNISLDWKVPADMADQKAYVGGRELDFCYGDCQTEMDMINKAFLEIMLDGDSNGLGFQYPIPTYSITPDFDWSDTKNNRLLFQIAAKYGTPYFSNYIHGGLEPGDTRKIYDIANPDYSHLRRKSGGFFGFGEATGSIGVVTINLPRIAYQAADEADFYKRLDHLLDLSARSLKTKRDVICNLLTNGLYPYTACYLHNFDNHFSTIGIIGMNEACLNASWLKKELANKESLDFAKAVMNHIKKKLVEYQKQYHSMYGLEASPAESASHRLASYDRTRFPDIITAGQKNDIPYYTNSTHLPVEYTDDLHAALAVQDQLQPLYTSGTVFHIFLKEMLHDWTIARDMVRTMSEQHEIPYYTLTPSYSLCPDHGYLIGEQTTCPVCGKKVEIYSRIVGYYRPISDWNEGKIQEFKNRTCYRIE